MDEDKLRLENERLIKEINRLEKLIEKEERQNRGLRDYNTYLNIIDNFDSASRFDNGYVGFIRNSIPHLITLSYNRNAFNLFMLMAMLVDEYNEVSLSRRNMREMLGVEYRTLEKTLTFLFNNNFIRELSNVNPKNKSVVLVIELNHQLIFNGSDFEKKYEDYLKGYLTNKLFTPIQNVLNDGAFDIILEDGLVNRINRNLQNQS